MLTVLALNAMLIAGAMSADVGTDAPGLERLYRFDDSSTEVRDYTATSAATPLPTGITTVTSDAPVSPPPLGTPVPPGPGAAVTSYVYDQGELDTLSPSDIAMEFAGGALTKRWVYSDVTDEPLGFEDYAGTTAPGTGSIYEMFADRQGSITRIVAPATGMIAAEYAYDAFGLQTVLSGTLTQPYGYTGREFDPESGLYHLRWRTYDPASGLFLQMDPLGFGGGQENLYAYTDGNPVMASDPMGLTEYFGYKSMIHGRYQTLGSATSAVSSGALTAVNNMLLGMGNWANYNLSPQTTGKMSNPSNGRRYHGNHGCNEGGQHVYVIYETIFGKTVKVGIGKEKDAMGSTSKRALRQYVKLAATLRVKQGWPGTPKDLGNTIMLKVPGGGLWRGPKL